MNESSTRISLRDFLASDVLSGANLRFIGDSEAAASRRASAGGSPTRGGNASHLLNATKLAHLLAKCFAKFDEGLNSKGSSAVPSIQLDDIFVSFQSTEVAAPTMAKGQVDDLELEKSAHVDSATDNFEHDIAEAGNTEDGFGGFFSNLIYDTNNDGNTEDQFGRFFSNLIDDTNNDTQTDPKAKIATASGETITTEELNGSHRTVLGIHLSLTSNNEMTSTLMQTLGNHILNIYFGQNYQSLLDGMLLSDKEGIPSQRSSKQRMLSNGNLFFSTLLRTGSCPVSVCRLLSDLIVCDEQQGGSSFNSFDEIIQDLEQMSSHPEIFLYDQSHDFYSATLCFGQRQCYGRAKELKMLLEISTRLEQKSHPCNRTEAVFVSGIAGSGKSHFVHSVTQFLTNYGWIVFEVKFKRGMEHDSKDIVSSLFENLVTHLVEMKSCDNEADRDFSRRATHAISSALDQSSISRLAKVIPTIRELFSCVDRDVSQLAEADMTSWELIFLLSRLLGAILSLDRHILMCCDDLQWCHGSMLTLIKEIVISIENESRQNFLFVGMYRHDEINTGFAEQLTALKSSADVHVTEIKLLSLSKDDISDMIMSQMRLPRRLVRDLANVVQLKTSGHAIFVIQFLNALARNSMIAYSRKHHRFDWDVNKIAAVKTWESVAELIVSNLSSLQAEALQSLRALSCFGVQTPLLLIELLQGCRCMPEDGILPYLPRLVEGGVIKIHGRTVSFSHDLIQKYVYENIPIEERRRYHLNIGTFVASKIALDSSLLSQSFETQVENLQLGKHNNSHESTMFPSYLLVAVATDQVNSAGLESVSNRLGRIRFSRLNMCAGKDAAHRCNFQASIHYYKSGINFLGDELWKDTTYQLCRELYEGLASATFATGDHFLAAQQANIVIDNVTFEESLLAQYILIRSLDRLGQYEEAVTRGLKLLHLLGIDLPPEPSPSAVINAMSETEKITSAYTFEQITNTLHTVDQKKRITIKCVNALITSLFRSASPYLPLVGCAFVNYSLQNGVVEESAAAFLIFGVFKIAFEGNYKAGCYWSNVVHSILSSRNFSNDMNMTSHSFLNSISQQTLAICQIDFSCTSFLTFYTTPFKKVAAHLFEVHQKCLLFGHVEMAFYALKHSLLFSFYGGEKLSFLLNATDKLIKSILKYNDKENAKLVLANMMIMDKLVGVAHVDKYLTAFEGLGLQGLLEDSQYKQNVQLIEAIHFGRFSSAFWMGDYIEATKISQVITALPSSKVPKSHTVFHTFFMGLIGFQMFLDGGGEEYLKEGKQALDKLETWNDCNADNFQNKFLLLEAENCASAGNTSIAKEAFNASIKSARDHGLVQEQGLACELYAKFLTSIVEVDEAISYFKRAHACYIQWGAVAKAEQICKDHNLIASPDESAGQFTNKHGRDWR